MLIKKIKQAEKKGKSLMVEEKYSILTVDNEWKEVDLKGIKILLPYTPEQDVFAV